VVECSMRWSVAVAIPLETVSARTLSRDTKYMVWHSCFRKSRMPRHKHFERRPKQRQPMRASPPMEPTVQPNGHVCATCGAVTGSPKAAKTKQITSQTWARLDVSGGGPLLWHLSISTDALQRISMTTRSSRNCLQDTGHAFHWLSWSEQGTTGWPNDSRSQHLHQGLQPSKQPNVGPFGRLDGWSTGGWDPLQN